MDKKIPVLVKITILVLLLWSLWLLAAGLFHAEYCRIPCPEFGSFAVLLIIASGVLPLSHAFIKQPVALSIMALFMVSGVWLFQLKNWARLAVVWLSRVIIAVFIVHFLFMALSLKTLLLVRHGEIVPYGLRPSEVFFYIYLSGYTLIPAIFFAFYFTRPKIKALFEHREVS
jgi:hypothetical protein